MATQMRSRSEAMPVPAATVEAAAHARDANNVARDACGGFGVRLSWCHPELNRLDYVYLYMYIFESMMRHSGVINDRADLESTAH